LLASTKTGVGWIWPGGHFADLCFMVYKGKFFLMFIMKTANFRVMESCHWRILKDPHKSCLSHSCGQHHWWLVWISALLSALPSPAASNHLAYFRSNCLGEGLRAVLTFLWRKKKWRCIRKWGLKVNMNKHNDEKDMGAKALWGITPSIPLIWSQNPRGPKEATKANKYLSSWPKAKRLNGTKKVSLWQTLLYRNRRDD